MDNTLIPLHAGMFMDEIISLIKQEWFCHLVEEVDHIIAFNETKRQFETFVKFLNTIHPSKKITKKMEQNSKIILFLSIE